MSRAVAHSIWNKLFASDPLSRTAGQLYNREVLSWGGGKPPKDIVESVLETDVTSRFLADSIINDISTNKKQ